MNAIVERLVPTLRTERLDHIIVINESHPRWVLSEFADYYNRKRPHRGLALRTPIVRAPQPSGPVVSSAVLGKLHHAYARAV